MKLTNNEDPDSLPCPHCRAELSGYEDDVSDCDYQTEEKDVGSAKCPACGRMVAVVRTHDYRLARFKETP